MGYRWVLFFDYSFRFNTWHIYEISQDNLSYNDRNIIHPDFNRTIPSTMGKLCNIANSSGNSNTDIKNHVQADQGVLNHTMAFLKPYDTVMKTISMPRWEKETISKYYSINFSGMVQEQVILPLIEKKHPDIFAKFHAKKIQLEFAEPKKLI